MKNALLKTILLFGTAGALLFIIFFLLLFALYDNPFFPPVKSFDFFIYLLSVVAGLVYYRFWAGQGRFSFGQGMVTGVGISLLMVSVSVLFVYIFIQYIRPEVVEKQAQYEINQFESLREDLIRSWNEEGEDGQAIYRATQQAYQARRWISYLIWQEIFQKIFAALFISFIAAAVLRR
ncbi:MAG: DUF4199 domain-containing protein [Bacteroidia bacterium]|nr:DUF4199 domain-containing protein [Bacteroidia bacterium]